MREASFYMKSDGGQTICSLCHHKCHISMNEMGLCGVRKNLEGELYSLNYGYSSAISIDPIEKKPLYHFYPSSEILSIGTLGCNLKCPFCQNWQLSTVERKEARPYSSKELASMASHHNSIGLAYTYSEPIVWYEFVLESAREIKNIGLKNIMVSNGAISDKPLKELMPYIDGWNIDLKSFNERSYRDILKGSLSMVKNTIESIYGKSHLEITTLIVTGFNDDYDQLMEMARWIGSLSRDIPWHLTAYHPAHRYGEPPTDIEFLHKVYRGAKEILNHVYQGNIPASSDSHCPHCDALLVSRSGYFTRIKALQDGRCLQCGKELNFIM